VITEFGDTAALGALADRLITAIQALEFGSESRIDLGLSAGIAVSGRARGYDPDDLLQRADEALYQAKGSGRGRHLFHASSQAAIRPAHARLISAAG